MNVVKIVATEYQDGEVVHTEEVKRYRCRYCAADYIDEEEFHEKYCVFDPNKRTCATCHYNYTYTCPKRKPYQKPVFVLDGCLNCKEWIPEEDSEKVSEAIAYKLRGGKREGNIYSMMVLFFKNQFIHEI